jgi:hypothetical protein
VNGEFSFTLFHVVAFPRLWWACKIDSLHAKNKLTSARAQVNSIKRSEKTGKVNAEKLSAKNVIQIFCFEKSDCFREFQ